MLEYCNALLAGATSCRQAASMEPVMDHHPPQYHQHQRPGSAASYWPIVLTLGFAVVEAVGGWLTGSLALLGDAGHMFSDTAALGLALLGVWIARRPSSPRHTYGFVRAEVI